MDSPVLLKVKKGLINEYIRKQGCSDWTFRAVSGHEKRDCSLLQMGFKWTLLVRNRFKLLVDFFKFNLILVYIMFYYI